MYVCMYHTISLTVIRDPLKRLLVLLRNQQATCKYLCSANISVPRAHPTVLVKLLQPSAANIYSPTKKVSLCTSRHVYYLIQFVIKLKTLPLYY